MSKPVLGLALAAALLTPENAPATLEELWFHSTFPVLSMAAQHHPDAPVVYLANKGGGVVAFASSPSGLVETDRIGVLALAGLHAMDLHLDATAGVLYVALGDFFSLLGSRAGLAAIDVSTPDDLVLLDVWTALDVRCGATRVTTGADGTVYLATLGDGVWSFSLVADDLVERDNLFLGGTPIGCGFLEPAPRGIAVAGDRLYVGNDSGGLAVVNAADPDALAELGSYSNPDLGDKPQAFNGVVVEGEVAYVATDYCGLEILQVGDPAAIERIGWWNPWDCELDTNTWFNSPGHTNQIAKRGNRVYLSAGDSELVVVDVSDPSDPVEAPGFGAPDNLQGVWGVSLHEDVALLSYVVAGVPFESDTAGVRAVALPEPADAAALFAALVSLAATSRSAARARCRRDL